MNPIYTFFVGTGENLYNYLTSDIEIGKVINTAGNVATNANYNTTGFISVHPGARLKIGKCYKFAMYDVHKDFVLGSVRTWSNSTHTYLVPAEARYIRISTTVDDWAKGTLYELQQMRPVYKDDLSKDIELETGQRFFREKLSGKLSFVRDEFDTLNAADFETEFDFEIYKSTTAGQSWTLYFTGKFMKTDCEWNASDRIVTVQPDAQDVYTDILSGLEKEFDLIKLTPEIKRVGLTKRPLLQVYVPGDDILTCFLAGNYWEQDCDVVESGATLVNTYKFALCSYVAEMKVTANNASPSAIGGLYVGKLEISYDENKNLMLSGTLTTSTANGYEVYYEQYGIDTGVYCGTKLIRQSDRVTLFAAAWFVGGNKDFQYVAESGSGASGTPQGELALRPVYARMLTDKSTVNGVTYDSIPTEDITANNRNYHYVSGYGVDVITISDRTSKEPTEWGLATGTEYYDTPYSLIEQAYFPVAHSTWRYTSIWMSSRDYDWALEQAARKNYQLRDAFPIASVISVLLGKIAPDVTHEATTVYSQFLYSSTAPIGSDRFNLYITPKSNILAGQYDQPAQKAPITLQQVMTMLRDTFRCYWYIDSSRRLHIEHVQYFRNGLTYSSTKRFNVELPKLINPRNGKSYDFAAATWSFDKNQMAQRYQFAWMDDVSQVFAGHPIEVLSKYVEDGKIEDVNVGNFTPDVDYMLTNPNAISEDGFALIAAQPASNAYTANVETNAYYWNGKKQTKTGINTYCVTLPQRYGRVYASGATTATDNNSSTLATYFRKNTDGTLTFLSQQYTGTNYTKVFTRVQLDIPDECSHVYISYVSSSPYGIFIDAIDVAPFITMQDGLIRYEAQNGLLSWMRLQPNYYVYDLPAKVVSINNTAMQAGGIERNKKQTVNYPSDADPDPNKLIKTSIGDGQIDKISVNLHSRNSKITLKYDTQ